MNLKTARNELAAGITAAALDVYGYGRPPGAVQHFPCAIVQDPSRIDYHPTMKRRTSVELTVRVAVSRQAAQDSSARLDELVSAGAGGVPELLESLTGSWSQIAVTELVGGYADLQQGNELVGVAADLNVLLTFNN